MPASALARSGRLRGSDHTLKFGFDLGVPFGQVADLMRSDWMTHREAMLAFWISGRWSSELPNTKPWLFYCGAPGTRPWAWWMLEDHPPINDDESEDEYLTRTKQWLPGERALFEVANLKPDDTA